jgi:hypothetical protein
VTQPAHPHHANLLAGFVEAVVLVGCVGGDASTQQRGNTSKVQVGGDGVNIAAREQQRQQQVQALMISAELS